MTDASLLLPTTQDAATRRAPKATRTMERTIARYIADEDLLSHEGTVLVALSGGADSVALLRVLLALGYRCEAAHCNFHLRGAESDRDERFVRTLCQEQKVALHVAHFDTSAEARRRHVSVEMAARDLRYGWFERIRQQTGATAIAVAHHRDDSVETLLLNLLRGTGINGLRGIRPKNGHVVRPLLCVGRQDIVAYLQRAGQAYVTDSTNLQQDYTRNKIRLSVLPLLESLNPSASNTLWTTARHLDQAAAIYQKAVEEALGRIRTPGGISIPALVAEVSAETILFEALHPLGFNEQQVQDMLRSLRGQPGKEFRSASWRVVKDRDELLIAPCAADTPPVLYARQYDYTPGFAIPREKDTACFDADKLHAPFGLRRWQQGDSFVPFGMKGTKMVSDYLTDRKVSRIGKERQWLLTCGKDIAWLVDERPDNRFRIDTTTRRVLVVSTRTQDGFAPLEVGTGTAPGEKDKLT